MQNTVHLLVFACPDWSNIVSALILLECMNRILFIWFEDANFYLCKNNHSFNMSIPTILIKFSVGPLRGLVQQWLNQNGGQPSKMGSAYGNKELLERLAFFPISFISKHSPDACVSFDDEDVDAWELEGQRWARVLFLVVWDEHLEPIFKVRLLDIYCRGYDIFSDFHFGYDFFFFWNSKEACSTSSLNNGHYFYSLFFWRNQMNGISIISISHEH